MRDKREQKIQLENALKLVLESSRVERNVRHRHFIIFFVLFALATSNELYERYANEREKVIKYRDGRKYK